MSETQIPPPVPLGTLIKEFELVELSNHIDISNVGIAHAEVNRPGLQLAGFYKHFERTRVQVMGQSEYAYLRELSENERDTIFSTYFKTKPPCLIISRGLIPTEDMLIHAEIHQVPIYSSPWVTSELIGEIIRTLKIKLAPRVTLHGVLIDIYGEGVVIMGESGVGKSETALELVKRGHRLVADDAVEVSKIANNTLVGTCPKLIQYFIELRGIGIIDVRQMFGVEAVKTNQVIDIVLVLEHWDEKKQYDRLGLSEEYREILGNNVVAHTIPIRPGRNLAIICEAAAVNHRQKKMGYSAAKELAERLKNVVKE